MQKLRLLFLALSLVSSLGRAPLHADTVRWDAQSRQFTLVGDSGQAWLGQGRLAVLLADKTRIASDDARFRSAFASQNGQHTLTLTDSQKRLDLTLAVRSTGAGALTLVATLANRGAEPLALDRIDLLSGRLLGTRDPARGGVLLCGKIRGTSSRPDAGGLWQSYYTLAVQSPSLAAGYLTGLHNVNRFTLTPDLDLAAWGECDGALLLPGQTRTTDTLFISAQANPLQQMERFADLAAEVNRVRLWPKNFAMWCTWYSGWIRDRIGTFQQGLEKGVEQNIAPVKKLATLRDATASYGLRICEDFSMFGDWNDVTRHIPNGLTRLADMIRQEGLVPGVWYTPYWVSIDSRVFQEHPEWMGMNADGSVFRQKMRGAEANRTTGGEFAIFDTSRPDVQAYFEQVARRWHERGFRYVTNDYLSQGLLPPRPWDRTKTKAEIFRLGLEATRRGLGDDIFFRVISSLFGPAMGLAQDMRVAADSFGGLVAAYEATGSLWFYNHRVWLNDPESIIVRGQMVEHRDDGGFKSHEWNRLWASWIALSGGVMTYGDRLAELPEEYLSFYSRMFPPLYTPGRPLDLWENEPFLLWGMAPGTRPQSGAPAPSPGCGDGPYELFGVFELAGERQGQARLNLDEISARCRGWDKPQQAPGQYLVWDFWEQRLLDSRGAELTIPMPSKSGRLFALRARLPRAQLLSTSGHFSQGWLETSDIRWEASTSTLGGKVRGNGGQSTTLYFHVPDGMRLTEARLANQPHKTSAPQSDVVALEVPATTEPLEFRLVFSGQSAENTASRPFERGKAATPIAVR